MKRVRLSRRSGVRAGILALALFATRTVAAQGAFNVRPDAFDIRLYRVDRLLELARSGAPFELDCGRKTFVVDVEPTDLRAAGFRASARSRDGSRTVLPPRASLFRGHVVGDPESIVRLSFTRDGLSAYVSSGGEDTWVEPLESAAAAAFDEETAHKTVSGDELGLEGTCAALELDPRRLAPLGIENSAPVAEGMVPAEAASLKVIEIAIEADFEYFDLHGDDTVPSIEAVLNVVDGIFRAELGLTLSVAAVEYAEEDLDPYDSTDALTLLQELQSNWNHNKGDVHRDVVHLFTGRELDGTTVGIAYVGEVCDMSGAYGLSQDLPSSTLMPLLVAHEIGHNLGAFHDSGSDDPKYIMNPVLSGSTLQSYSDESKADIAAYVGGVSCLALEAPPSGDDSSPTGGTGSGATPEAPAGGGGGGGGGPVDPLLVIAAALALGVRRRYRSERKETKPKES